MDDPALLGGPAIRPEGPPQWPFPNEAVECALLDCYSSGAWGEYHGPNVAHLEDELAQWFGVPSVQTCASGTLAMEIALKAMGVGPGSEVILAGYEYEPTFLSIHQLGAVPVLVDLLPDSLALDPAAVERAITPSTRAIIASHLHGTVSDFVTLRHLADTYRIRLVEDISQASGGLANGKKLGQLGDVGILSFGGSKLISAGRGGAIVIAQSNLVHRVKREFHRGIQQFAALSELQACVIRAQWTQIEQTTAHRHRQVQRLRRQIADIPGLTCLATSLASIVPGYYKLGFLFEEAAYGMPRDRFVQAMRAEGIAFDVGYRALQVGRSPNRYKASEPLPNAERAGNAVVILHHPVLSLGDGEVDQVAESVRKTYRNSARLR
jgi:perosamine synthetase